MAAPMTARAAKDTAIAGTRLDAPSRAASGCLSPCVALSGVSATCVPYVVSPVARFFPAADQQNKKEPSRGRCSDDSRDSPPKFGLNHGLIWLMIGYSRPSRNDARRNSQAGRLGGLEIDDQPESGWPRDRQVGGLFALARPALWIAQIASGFRESSSIRAVPSFRPRSSSCHIRDRIGCFLN